MGLISALDAARITVQKATWDMVSGWVGMVLLQGLHIASELPHAVLMICIFLLPFGCCLLSYRMATRADANILSML